MDNAQTPVPADHPLMIAWENYKQTEDYANTKKWAAYAEHVDGSLWAAFARGYHAARIDAFLKGDGDE